MCVQEKLIAFVDCDTLFTSLFLNDEFINPCAWICATTRKIAIGCFDVMLVDTIGDAHLLELEEEALDLTLNRESVHIDWN